MNLKTTTICLHRAFLSWKNPLFFRVFFGRGGLYTTTGDDAILGLIIFYVINCYYFVMINWAALIFYRCFLSYFVHLVR